MFSRSGKLAFALSLSGIYFSISHAVHLLVLGVTVATLHKEKDMISMLRLHRSLHHRAIKNEAYACICRLASCQNTARPWHSSRSSRKRLRRLSSLDRTDQGRWRVHAAAEEVDEDQIDFAVLRITLGIPGFDERQLPRVVAFLCLSLLFANRFLSPGQGTASQGRVEVLAVFLAAACFAVPALGRRLADARAGRSQASNSLLAAGTQLFEMSPTVSQGTKQELAWASYTLLRNTGGCSLLMFSAETVWLARGVFALSSASAGSDRLKQISQAAGPALASSSELRQQLSDTASAVYLPDSGALQQAGISNWSFLPDGIKSVLLQPLSPLQGSSSQMDSDADTQRQRQPLLLVASTVPRSLSRRERLWAAAIAAKLAALIPPP